MDSYNEDDLNACVECGAFVFASADRVYPFGADSVLCMECALRRGGAYDERTSRWATPPMVDDLIEKFESLNL